MSEQTMDEHQETRNELLESILQGLQDACLLIDDTETIVYANDRVNELFKSKSIAAGRKAFEVLPDHRIGKVVKRAFKDLETAERPLEVAFHAEGKLNELFLLVSAAPITIPDSESHYVRLIIHDETERAETEQIRKDFVANASHELRTPLSIINGYLENMIEGVVDDPEMMQRSLLTMQKHGKRIARIVEDMLTISKFESVGESESVSLRQKSFDCRECVKDVLDRLAPVIEEVKATVVLEMPENGRSRINGDRFYWDQIFFNLIENSLKENAASAPELRIELEKTEFGTLIRVKDDGVGIPRADLPFIFKRFYRVAKHHSQEIKGTGLGLSIVKRAIEAHGGTIDVDSKPGIETVFTISVPDWEEPDPDPEFDS